LANRLEVLGRENKKKMERRNGNKIVYGGKNIGKEDGWRFGLRMICQKVCWGVKVEGEI
jgi:hypothetical protein